MPHAASLGLGNQRQVRSTRKVDLVTEALKAQLIDGQLPPGCTLSVQELSQGFGVSKQPVMDALRRLQEAGFVEILPQIGVRVVDPSPRDAEDFFVVFSALEGVVFALAAQRRTEEDLAHIRAAITVMNAGMQTPGLPATAHRDTNRQLHAAIHRAAHSPVAADAASACWDRSDFLLSTWHVFDQIPLEDETRRNAQIAEAIEKRDAPAARELAESKILSVRKLMIAGFHKSEAGHAEPQEDVPGWPGDRSALSRVLAGESP